MNDSFREVIGRNIKITIASGVGFTGLPNTEVRLQFASGTTDTFNRWAFETTAQACKYRIDFYGVAPEPTGTTESSNLTIALRRGVRTVIDLHKPSNEIKLLHMTAPTASGTLFIEATNTRHEFRDNRQDTDVDLIPDGGSYEGGWW